MGAGSSYSVKATGGETTHTLTVNEMPGHNHGGEATSIDGTHTHAGRDYWTVVSGSDRRCWAWNSADWSSGGYACRDSGSHSHTITTQGGSQAHNNTPPYHVVYIWHGVS